MHHAHVFMLQHRELQRDIDDQYLAKFAEFSAYLAELRGLSFAIGDKELSNLITRGYDFQGIPSEQRDIVRDEMDIRGKTQQIHTRIAQLLALATMRK